MGLRDFLLGAQHLQEGINKYDESSKTIRQQEAATALQQQDPTLLSAIRNTSDPNAQAQAAARRDALIAASGNKDPYSTEIAKYLFPKAQKATGASPLTRDQLGVQFGYVPSDVLDSVSQLGDFKTQNEVLKQYGVQKRADTNLGFRKNVQNVNYAKDFNDKLQKQETTFDDAVKGLTTSLAQFKTNPNKSSLQQLAVSMARAGGDTGVLSNQDLSAYKLSTIAQDLEGLKAYVSDSPENALTPSVKKALTDMAEFGLAQAADRKKNRLENIAKNEFSVYGKDLIKGGKKAEALKNWEKKLGLQFGSEGDSLVVKKSAGTAQGPVANLMNAANSIKDPDLKSKYLNYFNKNKDRQFSDAEIEHIKAQMAGK